MKKNIESGLVLNTGKLSKLLKVVSTKIGEISEEFDFIHNYCCPLCGCDSSKPIDGKTPDGYKFKKCTKCGHEFLTKDGVVQND